MTSVNEPQHTITYLADAVIELHCQAGHLLGRLLGDRHGVGGWYPHRLEQQPDARKVPFPGDPRPVLFDLGQCDACERDVKGDTEELTELLIGTADGTFDGLGEMVVRVVGYAD